MKENQQKVRKHADMILGRIAALALLAVMLLNLIVRDRTFSELENRTLTERPKLTAASLTDGSYMEDFEEYQADQFVGRDFLRSFEIFLRWMGGNRLENGVYLGKDGQLLEEIVMPTAEKLQEQTEAINAFASAYPETRVSVLLVPDAGTVLPDAWPAFAQENDQREAIEDFHQGLVDSVNWIDAAGALDSHSDEKLYYKTDHHWTSLGALYAYEQYCTRMGLPAGSFTAYTVSDDFNGVLSSTSGYCQQEKETIEIYTPDVPCSQVVTYQEEQKKTTSLYDMEKLDTKDQYALFLGGNNAVVDIKTTTDNDQTLLLFKDSFANSMLPFLVTNYKEIIVVDPRYYYGDAGELMNMYSVDDVLILYSGNTMFTDSSLKEVLNPAL